MKVTNNIPVEKQTKLLFSLTPEQKLAIEQSNQEEDKTEPIDPVIEDKKDEQDPDKDTISSTDNTEDNKTETDKVLTEVDKELEIETEKQDLPTEPNFYSLMIKDAIKEGLFEDLEVEMEEGESVLLSDLNNISKELFNEALKAQINFSKEEVNENHINIEGVSEERKILAELVLRGNEEDILTLKENPHLINDPYEGIDLTSNEDLVSVYKHFYKTSLNLSEGQVDILAKQSLKDGTILSEVNKIIEDAKSEKLNALKDLKEKRLAEEIKEKNALKELRKGMHTELNRIGVNEAVARKFVSMTTEKKEGEFPIDTLYFDMIKDPVKASKLVHFMLDEEDFLKRATFSTKASENGRKLRKITETSRKDTNTKELGVSGSGFKFTKQAKEF